MQRSVRVELADRSYEIAIGEGLMAELGARCAALGLRKKCLVVTDDRVGAHYLQPCAASLEAAGFQVAAARVPAGEHSKSGDMLFQLYDQAIAAGLDRSSFIVALGGGVIGDLAGYAAASYLRGIDYVQVPTSVVALVDSSVGGKTGINLSHGKNLIGAFHQPRLVLADLDVLKTLPEREYVSGLAEVVKYGVIQDAEFFHRLELGASDILKRDPEFLAEMVDRCCVIKAGVVGSDERESGLRAILNFGHTLGHAIEKVASYGKFLHGEAISIGMVYAGLLSRHVLDFPEADQERLTGLLQHFGLPVRAPSDLSWEKLVAAMAVDKKTQAGVPKFVLADRIGVCKFGCRVEAGLLAEVYKAIL